jgi:hypothetical protein
MSTRVSSDSAVSSLFIRISATMRRSFDHAYPDHPWGNCYLIDYLVVHPGVWLCVGFTGSEVPEKPVDRPVWYYGADGVWFGIGPPVAVWQDAVVVSTTIPGHFLVIPDKLYFGHLPLRFCIQRLLLGGWLPLVWGRLSA